MGHPNQQEGREESRNLADVQTPRQHVRKTPNPICALVSRHTERVCLIHKSSNIRLMSGSHFLSRTYGPSIGRSPAGGRE
eukprot:2474307-Pyramimonas_sp.AAC.1